ncbi:hypothetical protein K466DRAFT_174188 [Polyporus arcularius HHB13444]|uniref:Uncharacterized protein n=1 Tax=Polyporus arcularius HHB13444 TaxID=1314778 RepID=A0A5C3PC90_9APHY|nr:hypothetical protein K466DRAFT_174188 [Polyporus arcularius HHB13444]
MAQSVTTRAGTTFSHPLPSPSTSSPSSSASSTALNSPLPSSPAQLSTASYSSTSTYHAHGPAADEPLDEKQMALLESLKRSITLVIWFKANTRPLRLRLEIDTFPYLRLSELELIVSSLRLSPQTFIDVYNPQARTWEQEQLCAVHTVSSGQRVLYRTRQSLIDGFEDDQCPGIEAELSLQDTSNIGDTALPQAPTPIYSKKRSAEGNLRPPLPKHRRSSSSHSFVSSQTATSLPSQVSQSPPSYTDSPEHYDAAYLSPMSAISPSLSSQPLYSPPTSTEGLPQDYSYLPDTPVSPGPPQTISSESSLALAVSEPHSSPPSLRSRLPRASQTRASYASNPARPSPSPATPSVNRTSPPPSPRPRTSGNSSKAWPYGMYVCDMVDGFQRMDALMPSLKQAEAFSKVFKATYKKSTVCNHRKAWHDAPRQLVEEWANLGRDDRALWNEFIRMLEGKQPKHVNAKHAHIQAAATTQALGSPQGGVISLGGPSPLPISVPVRGVAGGRVAEEPMGSLRPPEEGQYLG